MRFFLFDRITELERGRRMQAVKVVGLTDTATRDHYPRRAVLPPTLLLEAMAQVGGMLHVVNHDFSVEMLLVLIDRVRFERPVLQGETLTIEARSDYDHPYGATMTGEVLVDGERVASAGRIVYAHDTIDDPKRVELARRRFAYQGGDVAVAALR
jgi:3-hydroxyacyl-[acyl-carrier-protein] dehydratase